MKAEKWNGCNVRKSCKLGVLKQVNQGGLVKTAAAFEFVLVAGLNRANCKVANPPKTLGLGWFFKYYDRGFFSGHKCWVDHGYIRIVGASTILLAIVGTTLCRSICSWRRCWRWPALMLGLG